MTESPETTLARIEERVKQNIAISQNLLRVVKGDNGEGLTQKVTRLETLEENCPVKASVKWLTWGYRSLAAAIIGAFLWMLRQ